jgi:hypothetical protein
MSFEKKSKYMCIQTIPSVPMVNVDVVNGGLVASEATGLGMAHPPITSPRTVSSAPVCGEKVNNIKYY